MAYTTIRYVEEGNIGIIRLNRPERMNAVIEEMYLEIRDVFSKIEQSDNIRSVVLTGSALVKGSLRKQAFCAGADLKKHAGTDRSFEDKKKYIILAHDTCRQIFEFSKPVIAAINGPARGAGVEMALNCDFIYIAEDATLSFPETSLGTCVGGGVTSHLVRMIGLLKAKELIYSGKVIDGKQAMDMGLAMNCFPIDRLEEEVCLFARELAEKAPVSMMFAKRQLQDASRESIGNVLDSETESILECMKTEDWHEGVRSFSEKRKPVYKGR